MALLPFVLIGHCLLGYGTISVGLAKLSIEEFSCVSPQDLGY